MEWGVLGACPIGDVSGVLFAGATVGVYLGCRRSVIISYVLEMEADRELFMQVDRGFLDDHSLSSYPYLAVDLPVRKEDD